MLVDWMIVMGIVFYIMYFDDKGPIEKTVEKIAEKTKSLIRFSLRGLE